MSSCLVVGAGVNGLFSALALARAGLRVTLLERGAVGRESSWAGAGILSLLLPWDYPLAVQAMAQRGRVLWPRWADSLRVEAGIDPEYRESGMLVLGSDSDLALAWGREHGESVALPPDSLAECLADIGNALWLPDVAQVRNPRALQALRAAALLAGVEIREFSPVTEWLHESGRVVAVDTPGGRHVADFYVVAAGAWSAQLLAAMQTAPSIYPVRGQIVLFQAAPDTLPCVVYRQGQYLVPRRDGLILAGSTLEEVGFDKSTTAEAGNALQDFAREVVPALRTAPIVTQWSGLRPGSPGNMPTVDRHPELDNLFINSGHFRYGVTMAPAAAEVLLHRMLGTPCPIDPAPYSWQAGSSVVVV